MSFAWKDEHTETFLEMYRNHECLWNNMSENYHKTNIREKPYKTLHSELNLPQLSVNDISAKIKAVRTRYCSELAKIRKSENSGAGSNDLYVPRLFWFKHSPTFWKLVKRIEPLKGINTSAFIVHIHRGWIILDAHPKCKNVRNMFGAIWSRMRCLEA